jgi:hypothetical protein
MHGIPSPQRTIVYVKLQINKSSRFPESVRLARANPSQQVYLKQSLSQASLSQHIHRKHGFMPSKS